MYPEQSIRLRRRGSTSFDPSPQDIDTITANYCAPSYEDTTSPQSDSVSPHLGRSQLPWTGQGQEQGSCSLAEHFRTINEIRDTCRNDGTSGCLVYSNAIKTRRSSRGSIFSGWTSSNAEEKKGAMRSYIDHSRLVDTQATCESLRQVAEKLEELSESTTIRSRDIHGALKGFGIPRGISTYTVDQIVLDELSSCDPVVLTYSVDSGVFTRRPTY
ncbi:uncharacterized protein L199_006971 [Kwoniella botswanensis]|uniref:uncharacterized protein n=1 Tax=Kwoniella botswanensis TaxID=1268659 RepID=UPI00315C9FB2